ncbi:carbohydrate-binding module family 24 protein [Melanomma pulvis-pyrius CBS 109.77]|uniref:Carbohydrate-binding module family 24 protein n=1 Tax=Melanomma pulvis-pyrius CBS 109.77 TaxID=1314802 RepID=A0A6A6X5W9_9PLEO|nr:carbohydrate-binding module family 24 protein [Melanomma pulvis-pyrius CBS 109.77]
MDLQEWLLPGSSMPLGAPPTEIVGTKPVGYTLSSLSPAYDGLCPDTACYSKGTTVNPKYSPFLPPACTRGSGPPPFVGLYDYAYNWGFCPMNTCTCDKFGDLNVPVAPDRSIKAAAAGDSGLCNFACQRNYCPEPCVKTNATLPGGLFYPDPGTDGYCDFRLGT